MKTLNNKEMRNVSGGGWWSFMFKIITKFVFVIKTSY